MRKTLVYGGSVEIPDATPAIISEDTFNRAQSILKQNKNKSGRVTTTPYLLRRRIFCKSCGRSYWGRSRTGYGKRMYYCKGKLNIITPVKCTNQDYNADRLEALVWEKVKAVLEKPETVLTGLKAAQDEINNTRPLHTELETIKNQLHNREGQRDRIHKSFYITGDEDTFRKDIESLNREVNALNTRKTEIIECVKYNDNLALNIDNIKEYCQMVKNNLNNFTFKDKCLTMEALDIKVYIDGDNIDIQGAIPLDVNSVHASTVV